jgi:hypothetical protein
MNTKLMFIGAIIFSVLALRTEDLLFGFLDVYLTCLAISVFFSNTSKNKMQNGKVTIPSCRKQIHKTNDVSRVQSLIIQSQCPKKIKKKAQKVDFIG